MPIEDLKVKPEILSPKPPSLASDEEFAAGTSTTSSPTVKQAKEKLVTTNTTQTIAGTKVFTTEPLRKSTVIDITTQPENYMANNVKFVDKNNNAMGYLENAQQSDGSIKTGIHARNKDGYQPHIGVYAPLSGTTGAYATAPNTPDNAPANAIVTKDKIANMVTTNTAQTITGFKAFNNGSGSNRTNIDIITNDGVAEDANSKWAGSIQFKKGNVDVGYCEAMKDSANSSIAQIVAHNSVNGQRVYSSLRAVVTSDGTMFGTAPTTPDNAPANAIVTKDKIDNMVTTNTSQTITGTKKFSKAGNLTALSPVLLKENNADEGGQIYFERSGNSVLKNNPYIDLYKNTIRVIGTSSQNNTNITLQVDLENNRVFVSTPVITANDTQAATTAWFNQKMQVVSALPAAPNANVFYFIPG